MIDLMVVTGETLQKDLGGGTYPWNMYNSHGVESMTLIGGVVKMVIF